MMMTQIETNSPAKPNKAVRFAIFAICGGVVGYFFGAWLATNDELTPTIDALSAAQLAAMFLGLLALVITPIMILMSFSKKMYTAERDSEEPIEESEFANAQSQLRWAAIAMLAVGIELFAFAWPIDPTSGPAILHFAIIIAMVGVQGWASWILWKLYDELHRQVTLEGAAISYGLIMLAISIWAALAQLGFGVTFSPVGVVVAISILGTIPAVWLSIARGLNK
jgi:MFS family permease